MRSKTGRIAALLAISFFIAVFSVRSASAVSANIPLESSVYRDIEYLEVRGYARSAMYSTRPFTWDEARRLYLEARVRWSSLSRSARKRDGRAGAVIRRLGAVLDGKTTWGYDSTSRSGGILSLRPFSLYSGLTYSGNPPVFPVRNNNGDAPGKGVYLRAGLDAEFRILDVAAIYLNPEVRTGRLAASEDASTEVKLRRVYGLANAGPLQLEAGRDSMWWGAGYNGGLLMTDNAAPLEMIKLTTGIPFTLPWVFSYAGLVKPTFFLARLGEKRTYPRANLLGMRLDFKPSPHFQLALNRTFIFGGEGKRSPTLHEWLKVFVSADSAEHASSPINGDQLASIDASFIYSFDSWWMPLTGLKVYTEWGAEDSGGRARVPTGRANMYGAFITGPLWLRNADLRFEWANTGRNERYGPLWYEHAIYSTGYRHRGRVIGHHAGGDARDLFLRLQYHTLGGQSFSLEYEHMERGVHSATRTVREWYEADVEWYLTDDLTAGGFVGHEAIEGADKSVSAGVSLSWDW